MNNSSEQNHADNTKLLSDKEFVALMEAEYANDGQPEDDLQKQRLWVKINKQTKVKSTRRFNWIASVAIVAVFALLLPLLMVTDVNHDNERMKGVGVSLLAELSSYTLSSQGELLPLKNLSAVGHTLVFKVQLNQPAAIALALAKNSAQPEVRFTTLLSPDSGEQLIEHKGNTYGYMIEPNDRTLRFCVAVAENTQQLQTFLPQFFKQWETIPATQCTWVKVKVKVK